MRIDYPAILLAGALVSLMWTIVATAGTREDFAGDLVPFGYDSCALVQNGPEDSCNSVDSDLDGYGDRCDADYDQDGFVTVVDFGLFLTVFGGPGEIQDHDCDGNVSASDFGIYLKQFGGPVGARSLPCADPTIRVDQGDAPCVP